MEILGRDCEPPIFTGSGRIIIDDDTSMRFVMHATPHDADDAYKRVGNAQRNVYEAFDQFRITAVEYDGTEWAGGWTSVTVGETLGETWRLSGPIHRLHTGTAGFLTADDSSVELVYDRALRMPIPMNMLKTVTRNGEQVLMSKSAGSKVIRVLDADIEFFRDAEREYVWAVAETSTTFRHPHLENWISEPLALLLGEVVAPRLIARNKGDGSATVSLHPAATGSRWPMAACILREDPLVAGDTFWSLYADFLGVVALTWDEGTHEYLEVHPLTRFYHEVIQAAGGSNWVLCMTLASTVEGIMKLMHPDSDRRVARTDDEASALEELCKMVRGWKRDKTLRDRVLSFLSSSKIRSIRSLLRNLESEGKVTSEQVAAWADLRNASMHGEMSVPWAEEKQDNQIHHLIELTHRIAALFIAHELKRLGLRQ